MTGKPLSHDLFKMTSQALIKVKAFVCLRQSIARFLLAERTCMGLQADHPAALQVCINHFNLGPTPNQCLNTLIAQIAADVKAATQ